ncbi:hypothetical protein DHL47_03645 [Streptococcus panodentis]|uniref:Uncharacterized protein n=1 Tax=Streptococcus panodentis TaxID=1581472 RepID=A0ABS5AV47_9STRE|nr:hypothetical protein [Streptococcus panodentis]
MKSQNRAGSIKAAEQTPMMAADEALVREGGLYRPMQASLNSATTGNSFPPDWTKAGNCFFFICGLPLPYLPNLSALLSNS